MENLFIKETQQTPMIKFNLDGDFLIEGISLPSNVHDFYQKINDWIDDLEKNLPPQIALTLDFNYFNTSSTLTIHGILKKLIHYSTLGTKLRIIWKYDADDEDMYEEGVLFQNRVNYPFEFFAKQTQK